MKASPACTASVGTIECNLCTTFTTVPCRTSFGRGLDSYACEPCRIVRPVTSSISFETKCAQHVCILPDCHIACVVKNLSDRSPPHTTIVAPYGGRVSYGALYIRVYTVLSNLTACKCGVYGAFLLYDAQYKTSIYVPSNC